MARLWHAIFGHPQIVFYSRSYPSRDYQNSSECKCNCGFKWFNFSIIHTLEKEVPPEIQKQLDALKPAGKAGAANDPAL